MKKITSILLLSFCSIISAQIKTATVNYGVIIGEDEKYQKSDVLKEYYNSAVENAQFLDFILDITPKETHFSINSAIETNKDGLDLAKVFSGYTAELYYKKNADSLFETHDDYLGRYVVKKPIIKKEWQLSNETKMIGNYLCYKATTTDIVINETGQFNFPVTAWYAPKIPLSFGPIGYNGLPGLILELERRSVVYGAKKIDLNPKINPEINKPDLGKIKTTEEITKMRTDFMSKSED